MPEQAAIGVSDIKSPVQKKPSWFHSSRHNTLANEDNPIRIFYLLNPLINIILGKGTFLIQVFLTLAAVYTAPK